MKINISYLLAGFTLFLFACQKDKNEVTEPVIVNESEVITTLKITLSDGNNNHIFQFRDPDGEGGNNGVTDTIVIDSNKVYVATIQFLDESNPQNVHDITTEIKGEAEDHLICYTINTTGVEITTTDIDANNHPIGLETDWSTSDPANGTLTIRLRHQPGIKNGDCERGETDLEVVFPVRVK